MRPLICMTDAVQDRAKQQTQQGCGWGFLMLGHLQKAWQAIFLFTLTQSVCLVAYAEHPIFDAIEKGDAKKVKRIVSSGKDKGKWKEITNQFGWSALYSAAAKGDVGIVRCLLENGADPNIDLVVTVRPGWKDTRYPDQYEQKDTPLLALVEKSALEKNDLAIVDLLLDFHADFQVRNADGLRLIDVIKGNLGLHDKLEKRESPPIHELARAEFDHILTHNGDEQFKSIKETWPIVADGVSFARLVRDFLEKEMDESVRDLHHASIVQILQDPEPWLFSEQFPSREKLAAMLDDFEAVLQPVNFIRLAFAMQQKYYESLQIKRKSSTVKKLSRPRSSRFNRALLGSIVGPRRNDRPEDRYRLPQDARKLKKGNYKRMAKHIFALDRDKFLSISPAQFMQCALDLQHHVAYGQLIARATGLKTLVQTTILLDCRTSEKNGCETHTFWVNVAERLFTKNRDFFGLQYVVAGLEDKSIERLKLPTEGLRKIPEEILETISSKKRYAKYRVKKARLMEQKLPFISMCNAEVNDLVIGEEASSWKIVRGGNKQFNSEKHDTLIAFLSTWKKIHEALSNSEPQPTDDMARWLHDSLQLPEEYPAFLSFSIKPRAIGLEMSSLKILPLWGPAEFEDFYCVNLARQKQVEDGHNGYATFAGTIEYAMLSGLCRGIPLFYEYLRWMSNKDNGDRDKQEHCERLFSSIEACFAEDIMTTILEFESTEKALDLDYQPDKNAKVGLEQRQTDKEKATQRWIIRLVKNDCSSLIVPFKEKKGVIDSDSYLRVFSRCFNDGEFVPEDFNREFEALGAKEIKEKSVQSMREYLVNLYKQKQSRED